MTKASVGEHPKADGRPDNIHEEEDERDARLRLGRGEGDMVRRHEGIDAPEALLKVDAARAADNRRERVANEER